MPLHIIIYIRKQISFTFGSHFDVNEVDMNWISVRCNYYPT